MSELFFHDYYAPMLNFAVGPTGPLGLRFKPCSVMFVALFGSLGGWLIAEALTLSTPDEAPVWFPADHMVTGLPDIMRTSFLSGEDDDYMRGNLYFGIQDVYAPEYSKWTPEKNRGTVVFDESFNITLPEAQTAFLQVISFQQSTYSQTPKQPDEHILHTAISSIASSLTPAHLPYTSHSFTSPYIHPFLHS